MTIDNETWIQVAAQCRAVAHLAKAIAQIEEDYAMMFDAKAAPTLLESHGLRSHRLMEDFGNLLNNWDAATEEDDWLAPIFEKAREMFPLKHETE